MRNNKKATPPKKRWYRRPWVIILIIVALFAAYPLIDITIWGISSLSRQPLNTAGQTDFARPLPVPPLADSNVLPDGTRIFDLRLQAGKTHFFDNTATNTWGINGTYLGPTLRAKQGEKVKVTIRNTLPEASSVHWHGMHLPAEMDGGPHQPIAPQTTWQPSWTIKQPAATLWYHPHPHGQTEKHVYRGLAGMFILDDDNPAAASLPHEYGKDDIPVIVQDKNFTDNRQLDEEPRTASGTGNVGNEMLVNGARTPHFTASSQKVRLRLLNASTARIYDFGLSTGQTMQLVASDGGLLAQPSEQKRIRLTPGERAEVIVALQLNQQTTLRAFPFNTGAGGLADRLNGARDTLDILQLRPAPTLTDAPAVPAELATLTELSESSAKHTRKLALDSDETINGKKMDMNRIDMNIVKDSTEIWEVTNKDRTPHNFHIHDVQFRVLSANGQSPPAALQGRKDTISIPPGQTVRLIMRFEDYTSTTYPYMFHCHLLRHEDKGMMGQFTVLEAGQQPAAKPAHTSSEHQH